MVALYTVSGSVHPVRSLARIDVSNIGYELVCVPVRIQFRFFTQNPLRVII